MNILLGRYIARPTTQFTRSYATRTRMSFAPSYKYISAEVRVVTHIVELELELELIK